MNVHFISRAIGTAQLALKANGPTLMVIGGVVSMGASVITASKQTLKAEEILAKHVPQLEKVKQASDLNVPSYDKRAAQTDRFRVYSAAGLDLAKLYAVPAILFFGGAALVFGGHRVMLKRNASLALAFTTLQKAFSKYRSNVAHTFGPDADRAMSKGFLHKEIVDEETGKTATVNVMDWNADDTDPYNRVFEQGESTLWVPDLKINRDHIQFQRQFAQELLNRRGYLYLSEVYHALGFDESPISRLVGWKVEKLPDGSRNIPHVDFGLDTPASNDFSYSREHAIYLDFNCQGLIIGGMVQKIMEQA